MKNITLLLLILSSFAYSQVGTTEAEYNYITKGYKIGLDSGMDLKQGYRLENIVTLNEGNYSYDFKIFYREQEKTLAGIMMVATSKLWGNIYYLCIPAGNSSPDLFTRYSTDLDKWDRDILLSYSKVLSNLNSAYITDSVNTILSKK